jgi:hypothetical protein
MDLTPEQLAAYIKGELEEGAIASSVNPDGIFSSVDEKRKIIEYLREKNSVPNQ